MKGFVHWMNLHFAMREFVEREKERISSEKISRIK